MTRRNPSAPRQFELIRRLTKRIEECTWLFLSDQETVTNAQILEGDWERRVESWLNDPESGIGSDEHERMFAAALITKRYGHHLPRKYLELKTACLKPMPKAKGLDAAERRHLTTHLTTAAKLKDK